MKSHRAEWKDRRERHVAQAWWAANWDLIESADRRTGVTLTKRHAHLVKLNAVMSPRTGTLLKLFERVQHAAALVKARELKANAERDWNARLTAAKNRPRPKRKITPREV